MFIAVQVHVHMLYLTSMTVCMHAVLGTCIFSGTNYICYMYFIINGVNYSTLIDVTQRFYKFKNAWDAHMECYALGNTRQTSTIFHNISGVI